LDKAVGHGDSLPGRRQRHNQQSIADNRIGQGNDPSRIGNADGQTGAERKITLGIHRQRCRPIGRRRAD
jgi:hypothetical protein